jgi:16S rRNA processing protein RimM
MNGTVVMGLIGAPHGVRGELRVKTFTADPLALGDYGPLHDAEGRTYTVDAIRPQKTVMVVRFREVTTREQAEALNGTELFVDRALLPAGLDEDEYYHSDLIGLDVRSADGVSWGKVAAIHNFGGGDVIEIKGSGSPMIPFSRAAVPDIDLKGGFITIDPVAAGLVDTGEDGRP